MSLEEKITEILEDNLSPEELEVVNISHFHKGHAGDDGSGESHFNIRIISREFEGLSKIQCHRLVYKHLTDGLDSLPHAISINASST